MKIFTTLLVLGLALAVTPRVLATPEVFIVGDLDKPNGSQKVDSNPHYYDGKEITLIGARDEVVAFQVVLQADGKEEGLHVRLDSLRTEDGKSALTMPREIQPFLAHFVATKDASYSWGPGGAGTLPWRGVKWPDALVPFYDPYDPKHPVVIEEFVIDPSEHRNQIVWMDVFVPKNTPAGSYRGILTVEQNKKAIRKIPVRLEVLAWTLPAKPSVEAWTEVYRETGVMFDSGVKFKVDPKRDWKIYKRYVQLGHAHRILVTHRAENGPLPRTPEGKPAAKWDDKWGDDWSMYLPYVEPILRGDLFTEAEGYIGPGAGTGPGIFPAPFPEAFYGAKGLLKFLEQHDGKLPEELLATWTANTKLLLEKIIVEKQINVQFFAYIFDEVDGITDDSTVKLKLQSVHQAFEAASCVTHTSLNFPIRLLWTTHRPSDQWPEMKGLDLIWTPNSHALDPEKSATLKKGYSTWTFVDGCYQTPGDSLWFYHSGQPAIGNHTINQLGIDMALWGLMPERYPIVDGAFMWSAMNFPERWDKAGFNPYDNPSYRKDDTRWGNGTLIYPGSRLTMIGAARNIEGPIPSMRFKAWRSGMQMAEYVERSRQWIKRPDVEAKLKELIPAGFAEAGKKGKGPWSQNPSDYYAFREWLAHPEKSE